MAHVIHSDRDQLVDALAKPYITRAEAELLRAQQRIRSAILRALNQRGINTSARQREAIYRQIAKEYAALGRDLTKDTEKLAEEVGKAVHKITAKEIAALGNETALAVKYSEARTAKYLAALSPDNAKNLAATMTNSMTRQAIAALRASFVSVQRQAIADGWTARESYKTLQGAWAAEAANDNSFRFVDRSGRPWENARYLQMLIRTNAQRIATESMMDTASAAGIKYMQIPGNMDGSCKVCKAWAGRIITISDKADPVLPSYNDAIAAGMFHPNCIHRPLPISEDDSRDEINLQRAAMGRRHNLKQLKDLDKVQAETDFIDIQRRMNEHGESEEEAEIAVIRERLELAILGGTANTNAAKAVAGLTDSEIEEIGLGGIPLIETARKGEFNGQRRGRRLLIDKGASVETILEALRHER